MRKFTITIEYINNKRKIRYFPSLKENISTYPRNNSIKQTFIILYLGIHFKC